MVQLTVQGAPEPDESIDLGYLPDELRAVEPAGTPGSGIPLDDAPLDDDLAEALLAEGVDVLVAAEPDPNADIAALSYEAARDELVTVVARLEAGGESLEDSLALWERGEALAARCQEWLDGAQAKLTEATQSEGGGTSGG